MRLQDEAQLLDPAFRKLVLDEITQPENVARKGEYLKRYEVYKDMTSKYVIQGLVAEGLLPETIAQMGNRVGNVSLCRKVVNKLARAYSGGVQRMAEPAAAQEAVDDLTRLLSFDQRMKKGDRYRELQRNMMFFVGPEIDTETSSPESPLYKLKLSVLAPWQYDVIEDWQDREIPKVVIISDFTERDGGGTSAATEAQAGIHTTKLTAVPSTNAKDDVIADAPEDAGRGCKREFIWWCKEYHFTTNEKGEILTSKSPEDFLNPINYLPMANNADEQDGQFWAKGGSDLVDGSILVNKLITDMNFISYLQGYGQYVVTGQNVTKERFRFGPNNALVLEYDPSKEEPEPNVTVLSGNPPIDSWMKMIEQYVALVLTTNNLSPSNVSGTLNANTFPSGIAALVEQSEATDDISDKQNEYKDTERRIWEATKRWQNLYMSTSQLVPEFAEVGQLPDDLEISIKFHEAKPAITEAEKLNNLKVRKELGIDEMIDLIRIDNPDMTEEEATKKLERIQAEKLKAVDNAVTQSLQQQPNVVVGAPA